MNRYGTNEQLYNVSTWLTRCLLRVWADGTLSYYQYDAGGDRTYKLPYLKTYSNRSGRRSVYGAPEHPTLYASPYLVVTPRGYTKHYYAESERITSQIGRGKFSTLVTPVTDTATVNNKVRRADSLVLALNPAITDATAQLSYLSTLTNRQNDTCEAYWYHPDHLGSASWVTSSNGDVVQYLHYLPWGEDYLNQRRNGYEGSCYTFSAKEKDTETGLSYFGSRYYSSDLGIWLSVDPMSDKYPSLSPYAYCANNPVKLVDPNGEEIVISERTDENGNKVINISFTATLVNNSSNYLSDDEMNMYKNEIIDGIKKVYGGKYDDEITVNIDVDINIHPQGVLLNKYDTRHIINIEDSFKNKNAGEATIGGGSMAILLGVCEGNYPNNSLKRTAAHEFGHLLGLDHNDFNGNIMNTKQQGYIVLGEQIKEAYANYRDGNLNKEIKGIQIREEKRIQSFMKRIF